MFGDLALAALVTTGSSPNTEGNREHCCTESRKSSITGLSRETNSADASAAAPDAKRCRCSCGSPPSPRLPVAVPSAADFPALRRPVSQFRVFRVFRGPTPPKTFATRVITGQFSPEAFRKFKRAFVPEGHYDNSPAFQRWDRPVLFCTRPEGTAESVECGARAFQAGGLHARPHPGPLPQGEGEALSAGPSGLGVI